MKEQSTVERDRDQLEGSGIYIHFADDLSEVKVMIVGPQGTPYQHGFYFFNSIYPSDYPMHPPHVKFETGDGRVRFNPNLYVEGKVCLSILGTWPGPSWSPMMTLQTVLLSIQSLLGDHPIQNEPGFEGECGQKDALYNEILSYENIAVAVLQMIEQTPKGFECFRSQMQVLFIEHYQTYVQTLHRLRQRNSTVVKAPLWSFRSTYKVNELLSQLENCRQSLIAADASLLLVADDESESNAHSKDSWCGIFTFFGCGGGEDK